MKIEVYGMENPLIDILTEVSDEDIINLKAEKGIMQLIDLPRRQEILSYIRGRKITYNCVGSGPNTVIALAGFGIKAALAGKVGYDEYGDIYVKQLSEFPVQNDIIREEGATGSSIILITPDCERTMNTYLGVNRNFGPKDINERNISSSEFFYTTGYMWDTEQQKAAVAVALEIAEKHGVQVAFDVADPFAVRRYKDDFLRLLKNHVSIAFANAEEAGILFDTGDVHESLAALGGVVEIAVVKNGKNGSYVRSGEEEYFIPARPVRATDSTGAGDMYAAGFLYGICKGFSPRDAGICASYFASEIVQQLGAQFSPGRKAEIEETLITCGWKYI
ncbi:MAG TPA: adenosine kinase [Spirochaetia bacterium]|nr:adenosine kinase [Spirochaetia bacterium]